MTRIGHLADDELTAAVAGLPLAQESTDHLQNCAECSARVAAILQPISERGRLMASEAPDWDRQRQRVLARLDRPVAAAPAGSRWPRPLLAAAAAAVIAFGLSVVELPRPASQARTESGLAVEEVLAAVDAVLDDDTLPGFEAIDPGLDDPEALVNGTT